MPQMEALTAAPAAAGCRRTGYAEGISVQLWMHAFKLMLYSTSTDLWLGGSACKVHPLAMPEQLMIISTRLAHSALLSKLLRTKWHGSLNSCWLQAGH